MSGWRGFSMMTSGGEVKLFNMRSLINSIAYEDVRMMFTQQHIRQPYDTTGNGDLNTEMSYRTEKYKLRDHGNSQEEYFDFIRNRLMSHIENGEVPVILSKEDSFPSAMEGAVLQILEQFGLPEQFVQLSHNSFLVGDFGADNIKIFRNMEDRVAELVFLKPHVFCILSLNEKAAADVLRFLAVDTFGRLTA